jgi:hypothetical protein
VRSAAMMIRVVVALPSRARTLPRRSVSSSCSAAVTVSAVVPAFGRGGGEASFPVTVVVFLDGGGVVADLPLKIALMLRVTVGLVTQRP